MYRGQWSDVVNDDAEFEARVLAALEAEGDVDPVLTQDERFGSVQRKFAALQALLRESGDTLEPNPGWQEAVLGSVGPTEPVSARPWGKWAAIAATLTLAATLVVHQLIVTPATDAAILVTFEQRDGAYRSGMVSPGSQVTILAHTGAARYAELRIYLDGKALLKTCSLAQRCQGDGHDQLLAVVSPTARGQYEAVLITSQDPIPPAIGDLDADAGNSLDGGAQVVLSDAWSVR